MASVLGQQAVETHGLPGAQEPAQVSRWPSRVGKVVGLCRTCSMAGLDDPTPMPILHGAHRAHGKSYAGLMLAAKSLTFCAAALCPTQVCAA